MIYTLSVHITCSTSPDRFSTSIAHNRCKIVIPAHKLHGSLRQCTYIGSHVNIDISCEKVVGMLYQAVLTRLPQLHHLGQKCIVHLATVHSKVCVLFRTRPQATELTVVSMIAENQTITIVLILCASLPQ